MGFGIPSRLVPLAFQRRLPPLDLVLFLLACISLRWSCGCNVDARRIERASVNTHKTASLLQMTNTHCSLAKKKKLIFGKVETLFRLIAYPPSLPAPSIDTYVEVWNYFSERRLPHLFTRVILHLNNVLASVTEYREILANQLAFSQLYSWESPDKIKILSCYVEISVSKMLDRPRQGKENFTECDNRIVIVGSDNWQFKFRHRMEAVKQTGWSLLVCLLIFHIWFSWWKNFSFF